MRPWIVMGVAALAVACPQPDPTFSTSYDEVVSDFRGLEQNFVDLQEQVRLLSLDLDASDARIETLETLLQQTTAERLDYLGQLEAIVDVSTDANTVTFSGKDVRITTGAEAGRGNLYIGDIITGANSGRHNLVMGTGHAWSTSGSLILGSGHDVTGESAFVSGENHDITGDFVGLLAGKGHTVSGMHAATVSGETAIVGGDYAVVVSGLENEASGEYSVVVTGGSNDAEAQGAVIISGANNSIEEDTLDAVIVGGQGHEIQGSTTTDEAERNVLIGGSNNIIGPASTEAVIVGGTNNTSGGRDRCVGLATMDTPPGAPNGARGGCRADDEVTFPTPSEPQ